MLNLLLKLIILCKTEGNLGIFLDLKIFFKAIADGVFSLFNKILNSLAVKNL